MLFKNLLKVVWKVFDVLMFLAAAISANVTAYKAGWLAFGVSLTITFIIAGLVSESFGNGGDA